MTLREHLTAAEHDEIARLLALILTDVANGERSVSRTTPELKQAVDAALCQNTNFMNELRSVADPQRPRG